VNVANQLTIVKPFVMTGVIRLVETVGAS
jgi:hypothetical protein